MPKVRLLNGKPLLVNGKVALSDTCCCGSTQVCGSDCGHQIAFSVKFDQAEIDYGFSTLVTFLKGTSIKLEIDVEPVFGWEFAALGLSLSIPETDVPWIANVWYAISVCITNDGTTTTVRCCVNDTCVEGTTASCALAGWDTIRMGDQFGNTIHRSYKEISFTTSVSTESTFTFPTESFDSLVGNTSVVTEDGITVLRIDSVDSNPDYGLKTLDDSWSLNCCCGRDCTEISTISISFTGNVTAHSTGPDCNVNFSKSDSATWNRINQDVTFDGSNQFKLYFDNNCQLTIEINPLSAGFCILGAFEVGDNIFDCPSSCMDGGGFAITGFYCAALPIEATSDPVICGAGTIKLDAITQRLSAFCASCDCDTQECGPNGCGTDSGKQTDVVSDIPYTCKDVSALIGVYTFSHSGNPDANHSYNLSMTSTIA